MRRSATAAAILVPAAMMLGGCGSSGSGAAAQPGRTAGAAAGPATVITVAGARQVLSQYVTLKNRADKLRQRSVLAAAEGGTSYGIDNGAFKYERGTDPANRGYAALAYLSPVFLVPRQSGYPAWFAVRARQQELSRPQERNVNYNENVYLVFTRASASSKWIQVLEPNAPLKSSPAPQVATDAQGYATQVAPADAGRLALAPDQLPAQDVNYLDADLTPKTPLRPGLPVPKAKKFAPFAHGKDGLLDLSDAAFFRRRLPSGSTTLDRHATAAGPVFALRTTDGGVLVFYQLSASLTIGAPFAQLFTVKISGFFSGKVQARAFTVNYADQFAVYEAPGSPPRPRALANTSGRLSGECDGGPCK